MKVQQSRGRKAISGIIGAVILFAMLFTVGSSYFLYVNSQNNSYIRSLGSRAAVAQSSIQESLTLDIGLNATNYLQFTITNTGGVDANVTSAFLQDATGNIHCYGRGLPSPCNTPSNTDPPLPISINVESTTSEVVTGFLYINGTITVKLITAAGNVFSAQYPPELNSLARVSGVTNGIGSFGLVFNSFKYYFVDSYNLGSGYNIGGYFGSEIPNGKDSLFSLKVTNYDPYGRAVLLDERSALLLGGTGNNFFYINGDIVNYTTNQVGAQAFTNLTIPYGATALLNFSTPQPGMCVNPTGAGCGPNPQNSISGDAEVIILLSGFYSDNTIFAQTIPFAATYGTTAQITTKGPLSGAPGNQITLALKNFQGVTTTCYWGNTTTKLDPISTGTQSSITFTIPAGTPNGYYAVYVSDGVNIAYATVHVT